MHFARRFSLTLSLSLGALALAGALSVPAAARAQQTQAVQVSVTYTPILRLDLIGGNPTALHAGAGIEFPFSNYFDLGAAVGAGVGSSSFSGRGDLYGKFSLDPYHQSAFEPYIGGGGTVRYDGGGYGSRAFLLGFVGVNAPRTGGIAPGVELGFGGGVRFGVTLRFVGTPAK